jgi:hypothetical protein
MMTIENLGWIKFSHDSILSCSGRISTRAMAGRKHSYDSQMARSSRETAARMVRQLALARSAELQDNWRRGCEYLPFERSLLPMQTNEIPMVDVLRRRALDDD